MLILKRLILALMIFDNLVTQSFKKIIHSKYKRQGSCHKCGQCCEEVYLRMTPKQINAKFFRNLCVRWISWLYGFVLLRMDYSKTSLVFTCEHKGIDKKCLNYSWRPPICRNFPLIDYFEKPVFIKGCGFYSN